ncbi:hypothetical protein OQJ02_00900 [Legionella sp. PATHC032]|uniref:hypothetical protein n=1 Tax=Legionella sp. PATHC032 TaxID=2992039 RepID=UPI001B188940|nr:hypothetical protein [Legionella sp. PATHC032]MCW8420193.1 hypothetical protein [Legionella sp. PATHC032]HAZ7573555.1 hypothetical protein [Legionella pneumophila]HBA1636047.1 hypothetical protein [Legionella pneumophila]
MIKKLMATLLLFWGGGLLIKSFFIHPTIFTQIKFYGFTPYMAGNLVAVLIGVIMIIFGIKWLISGSKNSQLQVEESV